VTKAMLQSAVDTINNTINTKETAINKSISDLEAKHDQDVQDLHKDVSDLSDTVTQLDTDINKTITDKAKELQDNINILENKHDQDVQDINDAIDQLGQDINDEIDQLEQNVNDELDQLGQDIDNINTNISNLHTHSNKSILDNLTQSVIDNSHTHTNKSVLDNVTQQIIDDSHKHTNKSALDNLTQTVIDNSHKHTNQSVIDKFSTDNDGKLLYNNNELIETFTESDVTKLINYLWPSEYKTNFIMADNTYIVTQDNKIFVAKEGDS
jgi:phage host-nuclease inhibitor protein Gam